MGPGEYPGVYSGEMTTPPTWLVLLAMVPLLAMVVLLGWFGWHEWRTRSRTRTSPVHAAAWAMDDEELGRAIQALTDRERELLAVGDVDTARAVAVDRDICVAVSERRADAH
ncbi:hypothetical protein [Prescottella equi]|jgi:hypothetical protein|nr:hypothetical protein [Prescottella equi]SUE03737.1 membrane protein [Prescottella equi]SUE19130.1 membrane protein [Prescottella equi]